MPVKFVFFFATKQWTLTRKEAHEHGFRDKTQCIPTDSGGEKTATSAVKVAHNMEALRELFEADYGNAALSPCQIQERNRNTTLLSNLRHTFQPAFSTQQPHFVHQPISVANVILRSNVIFGSRAKLAAQVAAYSQLKATSLWDGTACLAQSAATPFCSSAKFPTKKKYANALKHAVQAVLGPEKQELFNYILAHPTEGIMLEGLPGTGKTVFTVVQVYDHHHSDPNQCSMYPLPYCIYDSKFF